MYLAIVSLVSLAISASALGATAPQALSTEDFATAFRQYATLQDAVHDAEVLGVFTHEEANAIFDELRGTGVSTETKLLPTQAHGPLISNGVHRFTLLGDGAFKTESGRILKFGDSLSANKIFSQTMTALRAKSSALNELLLSRAYASPASTLGDYASAALTLTTYTRFAKAVGQASCEAFDSFGLTWGRWYAYSNATLKHVEIECSRDGRFVLHDRDRALGRALQTYEKVKNVKGKCAQISDAWKLLGDTMFGVVDATGDLEVNPELVRAYFAPGKVRRCTIQNVEDVKVLFHSKYSNLRAKLTALHHLDSDSGKAWEDGLKKSGRDVR